MDVSLFVCGIGVDLKEFNDDVVGVGRAAELHEGSADSGQHPPLLFRTKPNHDEAAAEKGAKMAIGCGGGRSIWPRGRSSKDRRERTINRAHASILRKPPCS